MTDTRRLPTAAPPESVLEAVLERVTYANEETGYTIARVATERSGGDLLTVVGPLLGAQVGESLRLTGRWISHPRYGRQFEVRTYATVLPATIQGIQRYLGSGLIKGIGPVMAERMVAHFGTDILRVLRDLLAAADAIPRVRLTKIFRQAQQSGIVVNAHRVNAGAPPQLHGFPDFFWFSCEDNEQVAALTADIVARRIPRRFGLDPRRDVQVLAPMHRGAAGAGNLNTLL